VRISMIMGNICIEIGSKQELEVVVAPVSGAMLEINQPRRLPPQKTGNSKRCLDFARHG
jgi:hypothetical protein